jgi:hypothetical protein
MCFFSSLSPTDGLFVGYSQSIHGIFICIGYVSVMYRLCIGYVSVKRRSILSASGLFEVARYFYWNGELNEYLSIQKLDKIKPKIYENYLTHDQNITTKIVVYYSKLTKIFLERRIKRTSFYTKIRQN